MAKNDNVIILHRLMKNSINWDEYILFTEEAAKINPLAGLEPMEVRSEKVSDFGKRKLSLYYPFEGAIKPEKPSFFSQIRHFLAMQIYFWNKKIVSNLKLKKLRVITLWNKV